MFTSKLEEYCRFKSWPLPEYTTSSEGPPHGRRFKAVVVVSGVSYETKEEAKSSEAAQNEAARIAYERLNGPSCEALSSNAQGASDSIVSETTPTDDGATFDDQEHLCKNQLQIYAQKRNIALPTYLTEREGPPHLSRFKSKVSINGSTYEGPSFSKTVKQAENVAAQVALMSLPPDDVEEGVPIFCKNSLQELVQKEYSCLPKYNTIQSGAYHTPLFVSTVEIKGEIFQGQKAKTKKQSEMNAAMVAYTALRSRSSKPIVIETIKNSLARETVTEPSNITLLSDGDLPSSIPSSTILEKTEPSAPNDQQSIPSTKKISLVYQDLQTASSAQCLADSGLGGTGTFSSNKVRKIVIMPEEAEMIFPPGVSVTILHSDDRWTAMVLGSNQGSDDDQTSGFYMTK
ncbi:Double-stranded RNA-binding protein 1-like protein [Drosera capensis]